MGEFDTLLSGDGTDRLDLSGFGLTATEVVGRSRQDGSDLVIDFGFGDILRIENFDKADFDASDMIL